jgi:hypothetical protein
MRELLSDETMQAALLTLKDSNVAVDVDENADALVSVRRHSKDSGYNKCIVDLLSLADMIPPPVQQEETTYPPDPS